MKKIFVICLFLFSLVMLVACNPVDDGRLSDADLAIVYSEMQRSFEFFWETTNHNEAHAGYGLARDRYPNAPSLSSIAATGFALAAYAIGADEGWITEEEGFTRADKTMDTLLQIQRKNGFYYHFYNIVTGVPSPNSEVSIIDTGLLMMGAIVASEYFGGTVQEKFQEIYDDIDWNWYVNPVRNMFYMGYSDQNGFSGAWDHMAEQLILYVLAAGSLTHSTDESLYETVMVVEKTQYFGGYQSTKYPENSVESFYYSYNGSLFQHQFSHSFIDFRELNDPDGINWFDNATLAAKANYAYTQDYKDVFKTYGENAWGITASDGPGEYNAYGARPAKNVTHNGTIAPYGALASINYLPEKSAAASKHFFSIEGLWDTYGFKDAYNQGPVDANLYPTLASRTPWIAPDYIGIDKGITLMMISNYKNGFIWENVMKNYHIYAGLTILGFEEVEK